MKSRIKRLIIIIHLALLSSQALSVVPEIEIWSDGTNYRYLLKDWHVDYIDGRASIEQQAAITQVLRELKKMKEELFIIVEDYNDYSVHTPKVKELHRRITPKNIQEEVAAKQRKANINPAHAVNSMELLSRNLSALSFLGNICEKNEIQRYSCECRQAIQLCELGIITPEETLADLGEHVKEVATHQELKFIREQMIEMMVKLKKQLSTNKKDNFLKIANDESRYLVDSKTIHKLLEWKNTKHGIIYEGFNHIQSIKPALASLGYKKIKSIGNESLWKMPYNDAKQKAEMHALVLASRLNIQKTFQDFFNDYNKFEAETFMAKLKTINWGQTWTNIDTCQQILKQEKLAKEKASIFR